ncbi:flagellar protein FliT [Rossellomorea vietnamensis]|uniref:Flagellar protein FliT n=1 Tax=Rossellomorea vietnamensis TaxID=218284 RepID=A0A5D4MD05_9BACI|nr:flagellar protein FliT [Rossellomorea vietnamensis]TYR98905.1 flagellar protein FliT [Rossellomorea vietnamensis]
MSRVQECYAITEKLSALIKSPYETKRDEVIAEIEALLDQRQSALAEMKGPYSEEEKELGKQILAWNSEIERGLANLRNDIKRNMNSVEKKKTSAKKYTNPYESMQFDGMFYDKKK